MVSERVEEVFSDVVEGMDCICQGRGLEDMDMFEAFSYHVLGFRFVEWLSAVCERQTLNLLSESRHGEMFVSVEVQGCSLSSS